MNLSTSVKKISFLIPFFNEEKHIAVTINIVLACAKKNLTDFEIILINDGSTDRSENNISKYLHQQNIQYHAFTKNTGFGAAYLLGIKNVKLPFVMYLCADGDVNEAELNYLLQNWDGESLLVQYCENLKDRGYFRRILSTTYTRLTQIISKTSLPYYNGFNILPVQNLRNLQIKNYGFSTQAYILLQALSHIHTSKIITIGTFCRFNDKSSKALTFDNFINALYFYLYMMKSKWIPSSLRQLLNRY